MVKFPSFETFMIHVMNNSGAVNMEHRQLDPLLDRSERPPPVIYGERVDLRRLYFELAKATRELNRNES